MDQPQEEQKQQQQFTNYSLTEIDKKIKEEEENLLKQGIQELWIIDDRRNDTYKIVIKDKKTLHFYKYKDECGSMELKELGKLMSKIDDELEPTETTHRFFGQDIIEKAEQGDKKALKDILQDMFNDELRRQVFFRENKLPEPEKKLWLEFI